MATSERERTGNTPYEKELTRIKDFLKERPNDFYSVIEIAGAIGCHRYVTGKYLDVLFTGGIVERKIIGSAKLYSLKKRIPISTILSHLSTYVIIINENFVVTYVNEKVLKFEKKRSEDIVGKPIDMADFMLLPVPDIDSLLREANKSEEILEELEVNTNDKTFYFRAKLIPVLLENGKPGTLIFLDDISEIKQYQQYLLKINHDRSSAGIEECILSNLSDYIILLDENFTVTYVNEKILNFEKRIYEDIIGKDVYKIGFTLLSIPDFNSILQECNKGSATLKEIQVNNDGKTCCFSAKFVPSILEDGKTGILIVMEDITEIKQYQSSLKTLHERT